VNTGTERAELTTTALRPFQVPSRWGSIWQLVNSVVPYFALWAAMIWAIQFSYPLTLLLAVFAAAFLVRIFIIFHDCGHGSFFRSRRANDWVGFFTGLFTMTPHHEWWHNHSIHHANVGNLDKRGVGDIWTMTVAEYRAASKMKRLRYFLVRQPLFMLTVGPLIVFVVLQRFPSQASRARERRSILLANIVLAAVIGALCWAIGWKAFVAIQLPVLLMAGAGGIWLFYVQHQYEGTYWQKTEKCDFLTAAIDGSSFYRLPRVLQWFSGNIGFHHVHHLSPRIPNYKLEKCHNAFARLRQVRPLTLRDSMVSARLRLWDEEKQQLVGFREAMRRSRHDGPHPA
jgi:omega-6 fatty acid desaturase (delta-12 desaturase)